ncbi:MAG: GEVED domain-containing protein [Bacteroidota bacterium]
MKSLFTLGALFLFLSTSLAQSRVALTPGAAAHSSSILDMRTTQVAGSEQGFLMTRMDSSVRVNIASPANALWVYQNKEDSGFYYYDVNRWRRAHMTYGTVQMDNQSSIRLNGDNSFTVNHLAPGIDRVNYSDYLLPPGDPNNHVVVVGENTEAPLQLHSNAVNYCTETYTANSQAYINSVSITNGATTLVNNVTGGQSASTYYAHPLLDNSINDCVSQGDVLTINVGWAGNAGLGYSRQVWIDWDADGSFENTATENPTAGQAQFPAATSFNVTVPAIPVAAQAKFTAVRVMVRGFQLNSFAWSDCNFGGSTGSAEVEDYYIPLCSTSGTYPILKPFCSINDSDNNGFQIYCQDIDGNPINVKYHFKVHER